MCLHPIQIFNPNYGRHPAAGSPLSLYDCTSQFINVPCGHCPQCIAVKQMYYVQRVQMESLENHLFFATLTYNEDSLPRLKVSSGYELPYADIRDLQNCFKRIQKYNRFTRPFRWLAVSERGTEKGRPHFHVLFSVPKYENDNYFDALNLQSIMYDALLYEWRRNYSSTRKPDYKPLCTYFRRYVCGRLSYNFDLHYVDPYASDAGLASLAFYVLKYMLKPSQREVRLQQALHLNLPPEEYESIWPIVKSSRYVSHNYGNNASALCHICLSIDIAFQNGLRDFPCYINPDSGQTFPLAPYYRKNGLYFPFEKALEFYYSSKSNTLDTIYDSDPITISQYNKNVRHYEQVLKKTSTDFLDSVLAVE